MSTCHKYNLGEDLWRPEWVDWPLAIASARADLMAALERRRELSPAQAARIAARALPRPAGAWLLHRFRSLGWLDPQARINLDVLDDERCPREFRGPVRSLVRLALFGPGGQGKPAEVKHRMALYQQLSSEILREARDLNALETVARRVLNMRDVSADYELSALLYAFVAERRADLQSRLQMERAIAQADVPRVAAAFTPAESGSPESGSPSTEQIIAGFERMRHEFDTRLMQFDTHAASGILVRLDSLHERYPEVITETAIERCRTDLERVVQRRAEFEAEVDALAAIATAAARRGDHEKAAQSIRRLSTIRAAQPLLLTESRMQEIRDRIQQASEHHEHVQAAKALLERERSVADELKKLAEGIARFQHIARGQPHDSEAYRQADAEYHRVVREIVAHDTEWFMQLTLEIDELLEDLHDPTGRAEAQVTRFLESVRRALHQLRQRARDAQQLTRPHVVDGPPPPAGQPQPADATATLAAAQRRAAHG